MFFWSWLLDGPVSQDFVPEESQFLVMLLVLDIWASSINLFYWACKYSEKGNDMTTHSVFLPRESHGQRNLAVYTPLGHKQLDTTEWPTHTHASIYSEALYEIL